MATAARKSGAEARELAVDRLRQAISQGDMVPDQRLIEDELAERFGVTRASIRAALLELSALGLVERVPNRGSRVRVVTVEEAIAITECRMALEMLCARKAAEQVDDAQIDELSELDARMRRAVDEGDPVAYSQLNSTLHQRMREFSRQPVALDMLERLNAQLVRHRFRLSLRPGRPRQSLDEHLAIIEALRHRDPAAAERAVQRHLQSVIEALRATPG